VGRRGIPSAAIVINDRVGGDLRPRAPQQLPARTCRQFRHSSQSGQYPGPERSPLQRDGGGKKGSEVSETAMPIAASRPYRKVRARRLSTYCRSATAPRRSRRRRMTGPVRSSTSLRSSANSASTRYCAAPSSGPATYSPAGARNLLARRWRTGRPSSP
jgi:hypothetical protein